MSMVTVNGEWSDEANAWVSENIQLTGNITLEVDLGEKGIVVIKKAETLEGKWPKAYISGWEGPEFKIKVYGSTKAKYIRIETTTTPETIQYANI